MSIEIPNERLTDSLNQADVNLVMILETWGCKYSVSSYLSPPENKFRKELKLLHELG
jgi:hypothetical protein